MVQQVHYRYTPGNGSIIRLQDGAFIPVIPGNVDYDTFLLSGLPVAPADLTDFRANPVDPIIDLAARISALEEKVK